MRLLTSLLFLALGLQTFAAQPVIGEDIAPFGTQGVWANDPRLEEILDLMQEAGIRVARFDLCWWNLCEREPGVYNFTAPDYPGYENWNTDRLIEMLHERDMEPYAILCYGNALYDNEEGPHTPEARAAFARFCAEAATRYRDSIHIWEIWNEPNLPEYWAGGPDADNYALMAVEAARAIREANPDAIIVGPALSWLSIHEGMIDRWCEWLEVCGRHGLFDLVDAVSVHPYRVGVMPESINPELERIREIIGRHTDNDVAIWTGEWGYNTIWTEVDDVEQAKYLPRQFLNNLSRGVEMSIWFSFKPMEGWGMVEDETYAPRPAYRSYQVISEMLAPPVRHLPFDPLEITVRQLDPSHPGGYDPAPLPTVDAPADVRIETFQRGDAFVAAIWQERTADADYEGFPAMINFCAGPIGEFRLVDGLTGEAVTAEHVMRDQEYTVLINSPVMVSDYPLYLEVTRSSTTEPEGLWGSPWKNFRWWEAGTHSLRAQQAERTTEE